MEEKRKNLFEVESHKFQNLLQGVAFGIFWSIERTLLTWVWDWEDNRNRPF